jgi:hypothetical protein
VTGTSSTEKIAGTNKSWKEMQFDLLQVHSQSLSIIFTSTNQFAFKVSRRALTLSPYSIAVADENVSCCGGQQRLRSCRMQAVM